jgi:hypothetical protein
MKRYFFLIDEKTGGYQEIEDVENVDKEVKKQILGVAGADSEFVTELVVEYPDGKRYISGNYLISQYSNLEGGPVLNIEIGNYTVLAIKRKLPKIEFEIECRNNLIGGLEIRTCSSFHEGFRDIAKS